mmetsp:Transcript_85225/g.241485  ORF Transcript_85225/g.241485 Transcript_85225/m.241485 type:complete len:399 (+) Transcript_85225:2009-3205(+)
MAHHIADKEIQKVLAHRLDDQHMFESSKPGGPPFGQRRCIHLVARKQGLPFAALRYVLTKTREGGAAAGLCELLQNAELAPGRGGHPARAGLRLQVLVRDNAHARLGAAEEEEPLRRGQRRLAQERAVRLVLQDLGRDQEGEEHLVVLEEAAADVHVHVLGEVLDQDADPAVDHVALLRVAQPALEEEHEELEAVLVHGVDVCEVGHDKVEDGRAEGDGPQLLPHAVNLGHGLVRDEHPLLALRARGLGLVERRDERVVLEDVAARLGEELEDQLLEVVLRLLVARDLDHELLALLRQVRPLIRDDLGHELVLEAEQRHREVDDRDLDADLRQVVRVGHLRGHVEGKVLGVGHVLGAQPEHQLAAALEDCLGEHRLERRVQDLEEENQRLRKARSVGQ